MFVVCPVDIQAVEQESSEQSCGRYGRIHGSVAFGGFHGLAKGNAHQVVVLFAAGALDFNGGVCNDFDGGVAIGAFGQGVQDCAAPF